MTCAQLLGLSFVNFFPTYASLLFHCSDTDIDAGHPILGWLLHLASIQLSAFCFARRWSFFWVLARNWCKNSPPWIWATITCCANAWHAGTSFYKHWRNAGLLRVYVDRTGERFFHITGWWWGTVVGYIIGVSTFSVGGRYVAMFLMASGYCGKCYVLIVV